MGSKTFGEIDTYALALMNVREGDGVATRSAAQPVIGERLSAHVLAKDVSSFELVVTSSTVQRVRLRTTHHQVVTPTADDAVAPLLP